MVFLKDTLYWCCHPLPLVGVVTNKDKIEFVKNNNDINPI